MVARVIEPVPMQPVAPRDYVMGMEERAAVAWRVAQEARDLYGDRGIAPELVERYAHEAVAELWPHPPKVSMYVPLLALRRVRERIDG